MIRKYAANNRKWEGCEFILIILKVDTTDLKMEKRRVRWGELSIEFPEPNGTTDLIGMFNNCLK